MLIIVRFLFVKPKINNMTTWSLSRRILPITKKTCRELREESHPWQGHAAEIWWARRVRSQVFPLVFPERVPPKIRICLPGKSHLKALVFCIWKGVSIQKPFWWLFSLPAGLLKAAPVIVWGLLTAGGTGSLKHPRNVGASEESKSLE